MFFKTPRIRSKSHLVFVRTLPCVYCYHYSGRPKPEISINEEYKSEAAHIRKNTDGGIGIKPSDHFVIPLSNDCHARQHRVGELVFYGSKLDKFIKLARDLYENTGQREKCLQLIRESNL